MSFQHDSEHESPDMKQIDSRSPYEHASDIYDLGRWADYVKLSESVEPANLLRTIER